jgi:hypothetical protein
MSGLAENRHCRAWQPGSPAHMRADPVRTFLAALHRYLRSHPTLPQAKPVNVLHYHAIGKLMAKHLPRHEPQILKSVLVGLRKRYGCTYSKPLAYALWSFGERFSDIDPSISWSRYKAMLSGRKSPRSIKSVGRRLKAHGTALARGA